MTATTPANNILLRLKLGLFRVLEAAGEWRRPSRLPRGVPEAGSGAADPRRSLWIFVSTIGELNAIEPFITRLLAEMGQPELTLISDRANYGDAYCARYPKAQLEILSGTTAEVRDLVKRRPPLLLLVAEIPCLLHDAPCRFSYATVRLARQAGAPAILVNGWLYGYAPPSRLDLIENRLFARDYVKAFELMLVQTETVRQRLIALGASPEKVVVTGNIKFDAMLPAYVPPAVSPLRDALLRRGAGAVVVAGSVSELDVQRALVEAFLQVRQRDPLSLLVLAPRHPEEQDRMAALCAMLKQTPIEYRLRSQVDASAAAAGPVLVLDTMGELRACYQAATLAYVGTDHNVLEPLAFGKPVFVTEGWEVTYPSYPVYRQLLDAGALHHVASLSDLGPAWEEFLSQSEATTQAGAAALEAVLAGARGAVDRCLACLSDHGIATLLPTGPAIGRRKPATTVNAVEP